MFCSDAKGKKAVARVQAVVDAELGFGDGSSPPSGTYSYVVCVQDKRRAVGCAVIERIDSAYEIINGEDNVTYNPSEPLEAVLGIRQIWISKMHRRKGLATSLIDAARLDAVYGYVVPKEQVAFSQPTPSGRRFAETYFAKTSFLVYP